MAIPTETVYGLGADAENDHAVELVVEIEFKPLRGGIPRIGDEELACASEIISRLANAAYRGYSTQEDVDTLMGFYRLGRQAGNFDAGIEMALQRILAEPGLSKDVFELASKSVG